MLALKTIQVVVIVLWLDGYMTNPNDPQELLKYATAAAFGKLQEQGAATE